MNLGEYTKVLTEAEAEAVMYQAARVVIYRPHSDQFRHFNLTVHTKHENPDFHDLLVASVDHQGIITESNWIKEQLGLSEVAA
jgi:hypothetical protein